MQVGGDHYKDFEIQPVEYIEANSFGFIEGSILKYVVRYEDKGGSGDLFKAHHYTQLLIQMPYAPRPLWKATSWVRGLLWDGPRRISAEEFVDANELNDSQARAIRHLTRWVRTRDPKQRNYLLVMLNTWSIREQAAERRLADEFPLVERPIDGLRRDVPHGTSTSEATR